MGSSSGSRCRKFTGERPPLFAHHTDILTNEIPGGRVPSIMGQVDGVHCPQKHFLTLIAFELVVNKSEKVHVPHD